MWFMSLPNLAELPMPCTFKIAAWANICMYFVSKRCNNTFTCFLALNGWLAGDSYFKKQGISMRHPQCPLQGA